jgi:hypothetical protein
MRGGRLCTLGDFDEFSLCTFCFISVGMELSAQSLVCLLDISFRRRPIHYVCTGEMPEDTASVEQGRMELYTGS